MKRGLIKLMINEMVFQRIVKSKKMLTLMKTIDNVVSKPKNYY